jgi:hypothetical protein
MNKMKRQNKQKNRYGYIFQGNIKTGASWKRYKFSAAKDKKL